MTTKLFSLSKHFMATRDNFGLKCTAIGHKSNKIRRNFVIQIEHSNSCYKIASMTILTKHCHRVVLMESDM